MMHLMIDQTSFDYRIISKKIAEALKQDHWVHWNNLRSELCSQGDNHVSEEHFDCISVTAVPNWKRDHWQYRYYIQEYSC